MTTKAKDGRETLQERLRAQYTPKYIAINGGITEWQLNPVCIEAADALDAAARKELFDEGIIRVLTHERDGWRTRADAAQAEIARLNGQLPKPPYEILGDPRVCVGVQLNAKTGMMEPYTSQATPLPVAEDVVERAKRALAYEFPNISEHVAEEIVDKFNQLGLLHQPEAAPEGLIRNAALQEAAAHLRDMGYWTQGAAVLSLCTDASAPAPASAQDDWKPTHRHKKRGSTYVVVGQAQVQCEDGLTDYEVATVYRGHDGQLWVRRKSEFEDGRFEALSATGGAK